MSDDAIIAITGGVNRINYALDMLHKSCGEILLISGVNEFFEKDHLKNYSNNHIDFKRVFLGYNAADTEGNAKEVLAFIAMHQIKNITVVTNNYHIPRAKLLFESISNSNSLISINMCSAPHNATIMTDFIEYIKYLATFVLYKWSTANYIYMAYLKAKVTFWRDVYSF